MSQNGDRPPPHDLDAEAALIGAALMSREATRAASAVELTARDFYRPEHGVVWAAIERLTAHGNAVDVTVLASELGTDLDRVGGKNALLRLLAETPASANAPEYARIVRDHARRRALIAAARTVEQTARDGDDIDTAIAALTAVRAPLDPDATRIVAGGTFVHDTPDTLPAVWGTDDRVLWAEGESLLLCGPPGVGKTTIAMQLVAGRIGALDACLELPITPCRRVLYLACDRPAQIRRAMRRLLADVDTDTLDEHLAIWQGPPPRDFAKHPETLAALARDNGADCVFVDSLKDVALGLSDDEVGAGLNSAIQHALAENIDVCALHHQRKGQAGTKPRTLADVYGSTWITAGAGSVVLLWGDAGDPIVELVHLKQPAAEIGPLKVDHDHNTGRTTIFRGAIDPLRVLRQRGDGMTANDLATLQVGKDKPTDVEHRKAKRTLDRLVAKGLAHKVDGSKAGGAHGTQPDRYYAIDTRHDPPAQPPMGLLTDTDEVF